MNKHMYPVCPANGRTDTSREAAEQVDNKTWMNRVLQAVRDKPSTMSEVAKLYGVTVLTTRPRSSQLLALGYIRDSNVRRRNENGRNEIVYEAIPEQNQLF